MDSNANILYTIDFSKQYSKLLITEFQNIDSDTSIIKNMIGSCGSVAKKQLSDKTINPLSRILKLTNQNDLIFFKQFYAKYIDLLYGDCYDKNDKAITKNQLFLHDLIQPILPEVL